MTRLSGLSLPGYVGHVANVDIGPINVDQQKTDKATQYHWKTSWGTFHRPLCQTWSSHSQLLWRTCFTRKSKNSLPTVKKKNHAVLDDMEDD